jgi:hypothetical protein
MDGDFVWLRYFEDSKPLARFGFCLLFWFGGDRVFKLFLVPVLALALAWVPWGFVAESF